MSVAPHCCRNRLDDQEATFIVTESVQGIWLLLISTSAKLLDCLCCYVGDPFTHARVQRGQRKRCFPPKLHEKEAAQISNIPGEGRTKAQRSLLWLLRTEVV